MIRVEYIQEIRAGTWKIYDDRILDEDLSQIALFIFWINKMKVLHSFRCTLHY